MYSEKATQLCEISTLLLSVCTVDKSSGDFAKFCGLLRIYELLNEIRPKQQDINFQRNSSQNK